MKTDIHPTYHTAAKITCACGNVITTGATQESISVEICGSCHPFYTGKGKLIDTAGRVERFQEQVKKAAAIKKSVPPKKTRVKKTEENEQ